MIYISGVKLSPNIYILNQTGLYDFPKVKNNGTDWNNQPFLKFPTVNRQWQFENKKIRLSCMIMGESFAACQSEYLTTIKSKLQVNGLLMMTVPFYSNRAFLVELTDNSFVGTNYANGNCVFRFDLIFNEPQPFNIQFSYTVGATPIALDLSIGRSSPILQLASEKQRYCNVWFQGSQTEIHIEAGNYLFSDNLAENTKHHCIITGDIDSVSYISSSVTPDNTTIANYYFRNGTII